MNTPRIFARIAGILFAALSLTPTALAQNAAPTASSELINVAVYDAFLQAGADEPSARAAAKSVAGPSHNHDQLATKADLAVLQADVAALQATAATKADLAALETRLIWAGAGAMGLILTLMVGLFAMIVGIWRKIAELAEKMTPPVAAR